MTLPASGSMSLSDIASEFLATLPKSLSDFYKGGTYVPNIAANAAVPTSGTMSMSNFYSARRLDVTPAAVNWVDTTGTTVLLVSANQTITGIDTSITLKLNFTTTNGAGTLEYRINGVTYVAVTSGDTFSINLNDTLNFRTSRGGRPDTITVTIINVSDSNTTLDTYTASHT